MYLKLMNDLSMSAVVHDGRRQIESTSSWGTYEHEKQKAHMYNSLIFTTALSNT